MGSLDSLGVLNADNTCKMVQSPCAVATSTNTYNTLAACVGSATTNDELAAGFYSWATQFTAFNASTAQLTQGIGVVITVAETVYTVVAVCDPNNVSDAIKGLVGAVPNGVIISLAEFTSAQKQELSAAGFDCLGYQDIHTIDDACHSPFKYVTVDKHFCGKICSAVNSAHRKDNSVSFTSDVKTTFSSLGGDIKQGFKEGFQQLVSSVTEAAGAIGINRAVNAKMQTPEVSAGSIPSIATADLQKPALQTKQPEVTLTKDDYKEG